MTQEDWWIIFLGLMLSLTEHYCCLQEGRDSGFQIIC